MSGTKPYTETLYQSNNIHRGEFQVWEFQSRERAYSKQLQVKHTDLKVQNYGPYQPQGQLWVAVGDVIISDVH